MVSKGNYSEELENQCIQLRKLGFKKAYILKGGLNRWVKEKGPYQGKASVAMSLSAQEFLESRNFRESIYKSQNDSLTKYLHHEPSDKLLRKDLQYFSLSKEEAFNHTQNNGTSFYLEGGEGALQKYLETKRKSLDRQQVSTRKKLTV